jgi:hypothetical protein
MGHIGLETARIAALISFLPKELDLEKLMKKYNETKAQTD